MNYRDGLWKQTSYDLFHTMFSVNLDMERKTL
jgi:hypothetical protein